jgi:hypothetical protein
MERTVRLCEFIHPLRFLGDRRTARIELGVVELLPPCVLNDEVQKEDV